MPRLTKRENQNSNKGHLDEFGNIRKQDDDLENENNEDNKDGDDKKKDEDKFSNFSLYMDDPQIWDEELDPLLINNIRLWFEALFMVLSKDISYDQAKLKIKFYQVFEGYYLYHSKYN